jgi:hypothetical protein
MRIEPAKKYLEEVELTPEEKKALLQQRVNKISRVVAILIAFLSTFIFFFKILFF